MGKLFKIFRNGMRTVLRSPRFPVLAALLIALGAGTNPATFRVVLPQSLPSVVPSNLAVVWEKSAACPAHYLGRRSSNHVFGDLAGVADIMSLHLTGAGEPEELRAGTVSANFFQMIGVRPMLGRAFLPEEDRPGNEHVVILSDRLWSRRFGSEAGLVGKKIVLNGESHRVIGILPPDFAWNNRQPDVWVPYVIRPDREYSAKSGGHLAVAELASRYE